MNTKDNSNLRNREIIYDFIRVIACWCVIGIHCIGMLQYYGICRYDTWSGNLIATIVNLGLPMFTLLSGALILNGKEESTSSFYLKRFIKIIIPLYLYSFIYVYIVIYNFSLQALRPFDFMMIMKAITEYPISYHLWYPYMIIGIYLCSPYIKKMCNSLTDKECRNLLILIFSISVIKYLLPSFNININITNFIFIEWTLIYILGYLVTKETINKNYKIIYFLASVSFIINLIANKGIIQIDNLNNFSIIVMFEIMAVFIFFYRNKEKITKNKLINKIMICISKYSWEIFLIHVFVLKQIEKIKFGMVINTVITTIILIFVVGILSFAVAFVVHNVITKNLQKVSKKIIDKIIKIIIKLKININDIRRKIE